MSEIDQKIALYTPEFITKVKLFKQEWYKTYKNISKEKTPQVDGTGKKIIDKRPDGYDFIIEAYMRECLDKHFPGWSWEMGNQPQFLGSEWVVIWGTLSIIDEHLLALGINPPVRKFSATNAVRIKYQKGLTHTPDHIVDIGNDVSGANSKAFKKSINQLTHIGDDVYKKRIEEEGVGTIEEVAKILLESNPSAEAFAKWCSTNKLLLSKVFNTLGVKELSEITDFEAAMKIIKDKLLS